MRSLDASRTFDSVNFTSRIVRRKSKYLTAKMLSDGLGDHFFEAFPEPLAEALGGNSGTPSLLLALRPNERRPQYQADANAGRKRHGYRRAFAPAR